MKFRARLSCTLATLFLVIGCSSTGRSSTWRGFNQEEGRASFEVSNPTACAANVRMSSRTGHEQWLGTVPPGGKQVFHVHLPKTGWVNAAATQSDGSPCNGSFHSKVSVRRVPDSDQ